MKSPFAALLSKALSINIDVDVTLVGFSPDSSYAQQHEITDNFLSTFGFKSLDLTALEIKAISRAAYMVQIDDFCPVANCRLKSNRLTAQGWNCQYHDPLGFKRDVTAKPTPLGWIPDRLIKPLDPAFSYIRVEA